MKKTVLFLIVCCLVFCISCAEKPNGRGCFDLSNAKNLFIGSVGSSKGIGSDFGEVTKDNKVQNVSFDFPVATNLSGYTALPDRICQLNEDYILVRFGLPLILVSTSDGYGICLNHIKWDNHSDMAYIFQDRHALKRQFRIMENGDIYYLGRYLSTKKENFNEMTGFTIMKYDRAENKILTFFTYDTGKMRGGSSSDSLLIDSFENLAASSFDGTNNDNSILVAVPQNGSPDVRKYSCRFNGSFIGEDGIFYFVSNDGYVSIKYDLANRNAEISDLKPYTGTSLSYDEYVVINGRVYGLSEYNKVVCITAIDGTITDVQYINTEMKAALDSWDYAGDYIYISGEDLYGNKVIKKINTTDNSVSDVITDKEIQSFTASEEHGITFVTEEGGSYSLWVQNMLSSIPTMLQESTEAFQDLVKVD